MNPFGAAKKPLSAGPLPKGSPAAAAAAAQKEREAKEKEAKEAKDREEKDRQRRLAASSAQPDIAAVELDALVVMKVIQHCSETLPDIVTGALLGLDEGGVLRCTNSFPIPLAAANATTST